MQSFDIIKETKICSSSYRVAQIFDQFDLHDKEFSERFTGEIDLSKDWNIGVIVGRSGTGKSTIAKQLFKDSMNNFEYKESSVIDDFEKTINANHLFACLTSVGFSSPPSWLKPYHVLSNGEKMRVDLARAILQDKDIIVFDEYTSVVDREVAKIGSIAVSKAIKKADKKFIAVTCHFDILEWLEPDWVFNTDEMKFSYTRGLLRRNPINMEIYETKGNWRMFAKYHYLNNSANKSSKEYTAFIENKPVAIVKWIHFPHPAKNIKKCHRIVVLPDYQGVGIGISLLNATAKHTQKYCQMVGITTSLNGFAKGLMNSNVWALMRAGVSRPLGTTSTITGLSATLATNRNTYSFRYIGGLPNAF